VSRDLDEVIDELIATCGCPACHRYRMSVASRVAFWTVKLEESLGRNTK
jgi:hypothetical protein